jgi:hypothetical protein
VKIVKKPIKPLYLWLVALVLLIGGIVAFHFARVLNVPIHSTVPELNTIQQFQQQMDADIAENARRTNLMTTYYFISFFCILFSLIVVFWIFTRHERS